MSGNSSTNLENDARIKTLILCYLTPEIGCYLSPDFLEKYDKFILIGKDLTTLDDIAFFLETKGKKVSIYRHIDQLISGREANVLNNLNTVLTIY